MTTQRWADKKGLPEGHAPLLRELVVPVIRNDLIVAILGVGNKESDYTDIDIETVTQLADLSWEANQIKWEQEKRKEAEEHYHAMMDAMNDGAYICSKDLQITFMNRAMKKRVEEDIVGEVCFRAIHGFKKQCPWCSMEKTQRGESTEYEVSEPQG